MRFTVIWKTAALGDLMSLWAESPDLRSEISQATDEIERTIRDNPDEKGRPYDGDRILILRPLVVVYSVNSEDRKVEVIEARLI